ncbi:hypothetical protein, conserved in T. vivax [Trypanosoma vivax Y486]|uniref:Variant surface glycoprotein (VSG) n=1 Tax=Trypanosoma vivax (strain Y486) TaxID=1055687 RepID=F9WV41_TRYVY|nr:hypothetical protein, conserved in T. vivax [Trypanosoma vivax Y486]|eukprot:CCD21446.1 hypothetical protein, conserved in T. vivax [Trypanosoma vivax Y486]
MVNMRCIAVCLFALAAAACEAAAPKGLKTADGKGLCKYAGALRFAGRYATSLAEESERRAATAEAVKEIASIAASLAAPLDGKNESVVDAVKALKQSHAETAEAALQVQAELASQAARQLTFASGSLRSFVEVLAAMGTSAKPGNAYSCVDGDKQITGGPLGKETNANTLMQAACEEVDAWQGGKDLNKTRVEEILGDLRKGVTLTETTPKIGGAVTAGHATAECRLLGIAGKTNAGDGGLLLTAGGDDDEAQNTVHLGTFVKILARNSGSHSFDKTQDLGEGMTVDEALENIESAKTALEKHKAFACSETGCPALDAAKKILARTVAAIQHAEERDKNAQDDERTPRERTQTQIKARTASANEETGAQAQAPTENEQTGYTASDASQGVPFAATLAVAAGAATTHFVPQQAARH